MNRFIDGTSLAWCQSPPRFNALVPSLYDRIDLLGVRIRVPEFVGETRVAKVQEFVLESTSRRWVAEQT